mgnify:CR=1 FL=1
MAEECKEYLEIASRWLDAGFFESAYEKAMAAVQCVKEKGGNLESICSELTRVYKRMADVFSGQKDWYSSGQILFDMGRISLLCENFKDAAELFIEAGDKFSNSARLYRQAATSYLYGSALLLNLGKSRKSVEEYLKIALDKLDWEIERYRLLRDFEQLAQTYDDYTLLYFFLNDFENAINTLKKSAEAYEKIDDEHRKIAALRYSLIASLQKNFLNKIGWSKFNKLAHELFEKGKDLIAASIELLKINLYITQDEESINEVINVVEKLDNSGYHYAAATLMLSAIIIAMKNDMIKDEYLIKLVEILNKSGDVKLGEIFKTYYALRFFKPIPIDYLGKYKKTNGEWVRIW